MSFTYDHGGTVERIVAVEYRRIKAGRCELVVPFSVFTVDNEKPSQWISGCYDFEWCRRDACLYYHLSGCGGRFYIHPFVSAKPPLSPIWWDRSIVRPTNGGNCSGRRISDATVRRFGYEILGQPLGNPFEDASCCDAEYCSRCKDYLPTDQLCDHVWWCDECGGYSKPKGRCGHNR